MPTLWEDCSQCKNNCCYWEIVKAIYVTPAEAKRLPHINKSNPCAYLTSDARCAMYAERPADCRLFPFDIILQNGHFYWVIWHLDCALLKNTQDYASYLAGLEEKILPPLRPYLKEYAVAMLDPDKYKYSILREVAL